MKKQNADFSFEVLAPSDTLLRWERQLCTKTQNTSGY